MTVIPFRIELCIKGGKLIIDRDDIVKSKMTFKDIGLFLLTNDITQQNLFSVYNRIPQDTHISRQKRTGR